MLDCPVMTIQTKMYTMLQRGDSSLFFISRMLQTFPFHGHIKAKVIY